MIQLNLLPDVKLDYVNAQKRKRMITTLSVVVSAAFLAIFLFLLIYVRFVQKSHINALTKDIQTSHQQLAENQDLNKILTIQNQLNSLPELHNKKIISSYLFEYLTQLTPTDATISDVDIDFTASTLVIKGNADDLGTVNKFADTLKFTGYEIVPKGQDASTDQAGDLPKAFSSVVLSSFSVVDDASNPNGASYELSFNFDPSIFLNYASEESNTVKLVVPDIISTRSEVEKPNELFEEQPNQNGAGN